MVAFDTIGQRFKEELYDLKTDPWEKHNLVEKETNLTTLLKDKLLTHISHLRNDGKEVIK